MMHDFWRHDAEKKKERRWQEFKSEVVKTALFVLIVGSVFGGIAVLWIAR